MDTGRSRDTIIPIVGIQGQVICGAAMGTAMKAGPGPNFDLWVHNVHKDMDDAAHQKYIHPTNPTYYTVSKPNAIRPLGLRIKFYLSAAGIDTNMVSEIETSPKAPWALPNPLVNMEMT